jgi:acetolactate synthase small subunit
MKQVLFLRAQNQPTVLPRVFRILSQHGLPVDSLSFQVTPDPQYVQMTVTTGEETINQQIVKLLRRLIEVIEVKLV